MYLGLKYEQHQRLCKQETKVDLCPIVNCKFLEAKNLCPEHCKEDQEGITIVFDNEITKPLKFLFTYL